NDSVGRDSLQRGDSLARPAVPAVAGPIDPAVSRARRDSVLARVRRDSIRRAQARAADTTPLQIPGAPPLERAPDGDRR
ncbi:MAG: hypothetical protein JWL60_2206, partial [Gemmatimonadetes bacterium]|nr:hypothetical protein [Gemmatimonadota bacterium]